MATQAQVNASIIEALNVVNDSQAAAQKFFGELLDKMVVQADLMLELSERLEVAVDLITTHIDNHAVDLTVDDVEGSG